MKARLIFTLSILSFLLLATSIKSQTNISDKEQVYGNWTRSGSPYIVEGEAIVPNGKTLTIDPGVVVKFKTGSNYDYSKSNFDLGMLTIEGTLNANGNESNPIRFTRDGNSGNWGVLFFHETDNKCLLNYCIIEYTYAITSWDYIYALGAVSLFKSKLDMNHVTINVDNYYYPIHFHTKSELTAKSSILHNVKGKILCFYSLVSYQRKKQSTRQLDNALLNKNMTDKT